MTNQTNAVPLDDPSLVSVLFPASDDVLRAVILAGCSHEIYHGVPKIEEVPGFKEANLYLMKKLAIMKKSEGSKNLKQKKRELDAKVRLHTTSCRIMYKLTFEICS